MSSRPEAAIVHLDRLSLDALSSIFASIEPTTSQKECGSCELVACEDVLFVRAAAMSGTFRVDCSVARLEHACGEAYFICLPLRGEALLSQYGRDCPLQAGDFGLLDAQSPCSLEMSRGCDALWIQVPRQRFPWRSAVARSLTARRVDGSNGVELLTSSYIRTLYDQMQNVPVSTRPSLLATMVDLIGEALTTGARTECSFKSSSRRTLERARVFIERHLGEDDLSPARIAAAAGISSRYLSDLFAEEGFTTMRYVARRRLERCRDALTREVWQPGIITQIAFAHGFMNLSSFNRQFKHTYGMTPRRVMDGAVPASPV